MAVSLIRTPTGGKWCSHPGYMIRHDLDRPRARALRPSPEHTLLPLTERSSGACARLSSVDRRSIGGPENSPRPPGLRSRPPILTEAEGPTGNARSPAVRRGGRVDAALGACRTDLRIMWRPLLVIRVSQLVSRAADHR
jgi:hypothetical protein